MVGEGWKLGWPQDGAESVTSRESTCPASAKRGLGLRWGCMLAAVVGLWAIMLVHLSSAQQPRPVVYLVPIEGVIDLGLAPFVERILDEAAVRDAAAVILEIDTFGGRVDAAVLIRDALLRSKVKTVAFINKRAISAGALISLAAEYIAMAEGGTIGAATPVQTGLPGAPAQPVEEKTVSYMRKEFCATAETRKRPPLHAEAMVDVDVEIPGVIEKGKLLTLTTDEALEHKLSDVRADRLDGVLSLLKIENAEVRRAEETWAESHATRCYHGGDQNRWHAWSIPIPSSSPPASLPTNSSAATV